MANLSCLLASLISKVKGDHTYRSNVEVGDRLVCVLEPDSKHNNNTIVVKTRDGGKVVGHVPEARGKKYKERRSRGKGILCDGYSRKENW